MSDNQLGCASLTICWKTTRNRCLNVKYIKMNVHILDYLTLPYVTSPYLTLPFLTLLLPYLTNVNRKSVYSRAGFVLRGFVDLICKWKKKRDVKSCTDHCKWLQNHLIFEIIKQNLYISAKIQLYTVHFSTLNSNQTNFRSIIPKIYTI